MTPRPGDWSPLAGADPVPGDPDQVRAIGRDVGATAAHLRDLAARLREVSSDAAWDSAAGRLFRDRTGDTSGLLDKAAGRHEAVANALAPYAGELDAAQADSLTALRRAQDAAGELRSLDQRISTTATAGDAADGDPADGAAADGARAHELSSLHRRRDAVDASLAEARRLLAAATGRRDAAAARAAAAILTALDTSGLQDSRWDRFSDWVGDRWDDVGSWAGDRWDDFTGWVADHLDDIRLVQEIASTVATWAGLAALAVQFIPVVGQAAGAVLGAVALAASAVSLACNLMLASVGEADGWTIATDVVAIVTFGIGTGASRAALSGAREAVPAARVAVVETLEAGGVRTATVKASRLVAGFDAGAARTFGEGSRLGRLGSRIFGTVGEPSRLAELVDVGGRATVADTDAAAQMLRGTANARTLGEARAAGAEALSRARGLNDLLDAAATVQALSPEVRLLPQVDHALTVYRAARNVAVTANVAGVAAGVEHELVGRQR